MSAPIKHYRVNVDVNSFNGIDEFSSTLYSEGFGTNRIAAEVAVRGLIRHLKSNAELANTEPYVSLTDEQISLMTELKDKENNIYVYVVEETIEEFSVISLIQAVCDHLCLDVPESLE